MTNETWSPERIHKATGTKFTPAGYDYDGFSAEGFDRYGYDEDGYNKDGKDRYDNRRGSGLVGYETRVLTNIANWKGEPFRKTDIIPGYHPDGSKSSRDWHFDHKSAFDGLGTKGIIVQSGRRWNLTSEGFTLLIKVLLDEASA